MKRITTAALFLAVSRLTAQENDMGSCSTCEGCDDPSTYSGSPNPGANAPLEAPFIEGKVGFNTIDAFTGNAWRRVRDLTFPNAVGGLSFERIHVTRANNVTTSSGVFGLESGWVHNWQYVIRDFGTSTPSDPYPYQPIIRIGLPDGRDISFTRTATNSTDWRPAGRYPMKLTSNYPPAPTTFTLDFSSGLRVEITKYNYYGNIGYAATAVEDARLNRWTIQNTGYPPNMRPWRITGPDGKYITINYSAQSFLTQAYTTIGSWSAASTDAWQELVLPTPSAAARFLCLYMDNANLTAGNAMPVAELEFYDQNLNLISVGTPFGSDGPTGDDLVSEHCAPAKAFDGDVNTRWHYLWIREGFLGRDCGAGVTRQVKKIRYKPYTGWTGPAGQALSFRTMTNPGSTQTLISSVTTSDARTVSYAYQTVTDPSGYWSWVAIANVTLPETTQATYEVAQSYDFTRPLLWKAHDVKETGRAQEIEYGYAPNGALGRVRSEADATNGQVVAVVDPNPGDVPYCRDVPGSFNPTTKKAFYAYCAATNVVAGRLSKARDYEHPSNDILLQYANSGIGHLSQITDRLGGVMKFTHNTDGALLEQVSPGGKKIIWTRDSRQRPLTVEQRQESSPGSGNFVLLHTTTYSYNAAGRLIGIAYPDATSESWTYTATTPIQPETHTFPSGCQEKWIYYTTGNHAGKLYQHTKAFGTPHAHTATYTYVDSPPVHFGKTATIHRTLLGTTTYTYSVNPEKKKTTHPDGSWEEEEYDAKGDVRYRYNSVYTGPTQKWTYTYGSFREKLTETDPVGRLTRYDFGPDGGGGCTSCPQANGKPLKITWPDDSITAYTYDDNWNMLTETRAATTGIAQTTIFTYDTGGRLDTRTDYLGRTTSYTYATDGNLFSTTDPLGFTTETAHSESGTVRTETETLKAPGGAVQRFTLRTSDFKHRPLIFQLSQTNGSSLLRNISWAYSNSATYLGEQTIETNNLTTRFTKYEEDCCDNLRRITHPGLATTIYDYDLADRVTSYKDPSDRTWTLDYSPENTPAPEWQTITPPDDNVSTRRSRPRAVGGVASAVLPSGRTTAYTYDAAGQRTQVTTAAGTGEAATTLTAYNSMGRVASVTDADGLYLLYAYDALGRPTTVTDPLSRVTTTLYETIPPVMNGGVVVTPGFEIVRTKLADNTQVANRVLDYLGRTQTDTNANNEPIIYAYHLNTGLVLNYVDANSRTYAFTYDAAGQRLSRSFPAGNGHIYTWYGDGQLASETRPDTNVATITYDHRGFPTLINWSNNTLTPDVTTAFDNAGRLTFAGNGGTTITRAYDISGRLGTESSQVNWPGYRVETTSLPLTYTYDADSRLASVTGPAGNVTGYTYNQRSQFASVTHQEPGGPVTTFNNYAWTGAGRLGYTWQPIGINSNYSFDAAGQVLSISHIAGGNPFDSTAYGYDNRGRRTHLQRPGGRGDVFAYDNANQIDTGHYDVNNPTGGSTAGFTGSDNFDFDAMGNRDDVTTVTNGSGPIFTDYSPNSLNQYSAVAGLSHTHNANGAMTSDASTAFTWDSEDRLLSTVPTGTIGSRRTVTYLYDAFHRRLGKAVLNGSTVEKVIRYSYDQWNPVHEAETDGAGNPTDTRTLVWGPDVSGNLQDAGGVGGIIAQKSLGTWAYYYCDGNGNVTSIVSSAVTAAYRYDAFGNVLASSGGMAASNKFRFSTKPVDDECVIGGLAYYGYRYYHFALGRWPSRDLLEEAGGINRLAMVGNSAINYVDFLGLLISPLTDPEWQLQKEPGEDIQASIRAAAGGNLCNCDKMASTGFRILVYGPASNNGDPKIESYLKAARLFVNDVQQKDPFKRYPYIPEYAYSQTFTPQSNCPTGKQSGEVSFKIALSPDRKNKQFLKKPNGAELNMKVKWSYECEGSCSESSTGSSPGGATGGSSGSSTASERTCKVKTALKLEKIEE